MILVDMKGDLSRPEKCNREIELLLKELQIIDVKDKLRAAARKIRGLYTTAYPEYEESISDEGAFDTFVAELLDAHPRFSAVGFWRVLVKGVIGLFERQVEGDEVPSAAQLHDDIIDELKEL